MNKKAKFLLVPAMTLGTIGLTAAPAIAATNDSPAAYQAQLAELNGSGASGTVMVTVDGDQATGKLRVSGLAAEFDGAPYPHVQHIHVGGNGTCPAPDADTNGDGVLSTVEGQPDYGMIATTLSSSGDTSSAVGTDLTVAGMGDSYDYNRTFTINAETVAGHQTGTASVVVHGLDPSTLSQEAQDSPSELVPELPLAAPSPALCGTLAASQMGEMPNGAPMTGGGSTSTGANIGMITLGGLVLAAGGAVFLRRRISHSTDAR